MKNLVNRVIAQMLMLYFKLFRKPILKKEIKLPSLDYNHIEIDFNNYVYVYINEKFAYSDKKRKIK